MIIITYVDDCIIVSDSMKDINTFLKSMKDGPEEYVLTDEGDIKKFLGIEIKNYKEQTWIITTILNSLPAKSCYGGMKNSCLDGF